MALSLLALGYGAACVQNGEAPLATSKSNLDTAATSVFCASPPSGDRYCVPTTQGPAAAWDQAKARGLPVTMWAEWPGNLALEDVIKNPDVIRAWEADLDTALAFVRDTGRSAESYRASLAKVDGLLGAARTRQTQIEGAMPPNPVQKFEQAIRDKAAAVEGPEFAKLSADKASAASVSAILQAAQAQLAAFDPDLQKLLRDFGAYRAGESALTAALADASRRASAADLASLWAPANDLVTIAWNDRATGSGLSTTATRLDAQYRSITNALSDQLQPFADFLATAGRGLPDLGAQVHPSLSGIVAYCDGRRARVDSVVNRLLAQISDRRQALIEQGANAATRATRDQAHFLAASTEFLNKITAQIDDLWHTPEMSATAHLPYLGKIYDRFTTFRQLDALCTTTATTSWREAGCVAQRRNSQTAATYQGQTIPTLVRMGLGQLRPSVTDPHMVDLALTRLEQGDFRGALTIYDLILRTLDAGTKAGGQ